MSAIAWPRTLLWRTFLLIVLLVVLSLTAWFQIYNHYALRPRAAQAAQTVASVVNLTRAALVAADDNRRLSLLAELNSLEGIQVYPAEPDDPVVPLPATESMHVLQDQVRIRLGLFTRFSSRLRGESGFFVSFRLDDYTPDDEYWVMMPPEKFAKAGFAEWAGWAIAATAMSLLGAYLLVFGITRPLKALEQAAGRIGRGEQIEPLPELGSNEVVAVSRAFNQMTHDLAQLESDRALILAGVSHDLRTPLARLRLGIEMSGAIEEDVVAMCNDIEEMDRIINQFLDFARNAHTESVSATDLSALVQEIADRYKKRGSLIRVGRLDEVHLEVRSMAVQRAVTNLIDNALRYGGADNPVDIHLHSVGGGCEIEVADRGPGIPVEETERLKRPFTRLESARTNVGGSGLGLAIVDRVARMHGGSLELLPRPGGGLRALLRLPRSGTNKPGVLSRSAPVDSL